MNWPKRTVALLAAAVMLNTTAYGSEAVENDIHALYHTQLPTETKADAKELTLEMAVEKTVCNSTALKKASSSLETARQNVEDLGESFRYSTDENWSSLLNLIKTQSNYSNALLSMDAQEKSLRHSMKQAYVSTLNSEREIALAKMALKNEEQELVITRSKAELGLVSSQALSEAELAFTKSKTALSQKETALSEEYVSLNTLMGEKRDTAYQLRLPMAYEKLEPPADLDQYVQTQVSKNESIKQSENDLKLAKDQLTLYTAGNGSSYVSLEDNVNNLSLSLSDEKKQLENSIRSTYNKILEMEESIENHEAELVNLKEALVIAETKYDRKLITELALNQAKYQVAQMESTLIGEIYDHRLLVEEFEDSSLL